METQGKTAASPLPALKICGVRTEADVSLCLETGVDYVGFNFFRGSKRYVAPEAAAALWRQALAVTAPVLSRPGTTQAVAVLVDATDDEVEQALLAFPELVALQFHGAESPDRLVQLARRLGGRAVWKAIGVRNASDVGRAAAFAAVAAVVLLDAPADARHVGGTGRRFAWELVAGLAADAVLGVAGGLRPGVLAELEAALRPRVPALIDVCSGVELAPGVKDGAAVVALADELRRTFGGKR